MNNYSNFSNQLLTWSKVHGRHDLPWQRDPSPYRVWVSEIMLQQTQVITVLKYYQLFMKSFSSVKLLADAELDQVLKLWSGLGYYARARNLHQCAKIIDQQHSGHFPDNLEELIQLPGIGRSTAGAILSLGMGIRAPILDGNVKRVLSRFYAIEGIPTETEVNKKMWWLAEQLTPHKEFGPYNQAMMDLGATICTRRHPDCHQCPVNKNCQAFAQNRTHEFPFTKKVKPRPVKKIHLLIIKNNNGNIYLEKRPPIGIWGGLWSFPECEKYEDIELWCTNYFQAKILSQELWPTFSHTFTHFDLLIQPVFLNLQLKPTQVMEGSSQFWYNLDDQFPGGIPTPISQLFKRLQVKS